MPNTPGLQKLLLHIATIISTVYELNDHWSPKGPIFLAFQQMGYDLEYFDSLIMIGEKAGYWTSTNQILTLTEKGKEKGKELSTLEKRLNS